MTHLKKRSTEIMDQSIPSSKNDFPKTSIYKTKRKRHSKDNIVLTERIQNCTNCKKPKIVETYNTTPAHTLPKKPQTRSTKMGLHEFLNSMGESNAQYMKSLIIAHAKGMQSIQRKEFERKDNITTRSSKTQLSIITNSTDDFDCEKLLKEIN